MTTNDNTDRAPDWLAHRPDLLARWYADRLAEHRRTPCRCDNCGVGLAAVAPCCPLCGGRSVRTPPPVKPQGLP